MLNLSEWNHRHPDWISTLVICNFYKKSPLLFVIIQSIQWLFAMGNFDE